MAWTVRRRIDGPPSAIHLVQEFIDTWRGSWFSSLPPSLWIGWGCLVSCLKSLLLLSHLTPCNQSWTSLVTILKVLYIIIGLRLQSIAFPIRLKNCSWCETVSASQAYFHSGKGMMPPLELQKSWPIYKLRQYRYVLDPYTVLKSLVRAKCRCLWIQWWQ